MRPEHAAAAAELEKQCFSAPWSEQAILSELESPMTCYVALLCEGELAGYGGMMSVLDAGFVNNICVSPDFRRQGWGRGATFPTAEYELLC